MAPISNTDLNGIADALFDTHLTLQEGICKVLECPEVPDKETLIPLVRRELFIRESLVECPECGLWEEVSWQTQVKEVNGEIKFDRVLTIDNHDCPKTLPLEETNEDQSQADRYKELPNQTVQVG